MLTTDATKRSRHAPGPSGGFLLGSLREFQRDAIGFLSRSVQEYGDVVRFRFGPITAHLVNRPEYIEHVFGRGGGRYDKRTRSVSKIHATCGDSLLASDGELWLRHRRLLQPFFQPSYLRSFGELVDGATEDLVTRWRQAAAAGQSVDVVAEMMHLTLRIAAGVFFESDVEEETQAIRESLDTVLEDTWRRLETPIDLSVLSASFHRRKFRRALRQIDQVVYRIIEERRQRGTAKNDLLSALLHAHEAEDETRLSDKELRDAVVTLLLAGHETTASALAWTFYLVARTPEVESKLQQESLLNVRGQEDELCQAKMAFSEAIRLFPSIWIIERRVVTEDKIAGYVIPRGSTLIASPYLLHRHAEFWSNPGEFDPERFAAGRQADRPRHAYIPFGAGPHKCIGEHMATMVASRILSRIYREFRLRLVDEQPVEMLPGITLRHRGELRLRLERTQSTDSLFQDATTSPKPAAEVK